MSRDPKTIAVTVLSVLLGVGFIFMFGGSKLMPGEEMIANFARWGYPAWFVTVTGAIEVLGGILLLMPKTRFYGAALLVATMVGAIFTHIGAGEFGALGFPGVLLVLSAIVAALSIPMELRQRVMST